MGKKELWIVAAAICAAAVLVISQFAGAAVETGAWGLHFPKGEASPSGPNTDAELARYDAVYRGNPEEKVLYLTFDAGYENGYTEKILDVLKKHQVTAAFFLVGNYLERNADLVRRMVEEGHTVGNHTLTHPDMTKCSGEEFTRELTGLEERFKEITGKDLPKYYRPPQGLYSEQNLKKAKELGYKTVFWSLAYADWDNNAQPSGDLALEKLMSRTHPGAVVLLHSTSSTNAQILDELLTRWKNQGYRFESIQTLFSES